MFADLDETIRQLLIRDVPINPSEVDVSFEAPDREWSGRLSRPTVNCFLYDVRENHELRRTDWETHTNGRAGVKQRLPLRFDVTYQVSAWARAPEDEHRLLWRVLSALVRHPTLPADLLQGALRTQQPSIPAKVGQPDQTPKNPADLWQALENRIRPSLTYVVTTAVDPAVVHTTPLVFTSDLRLRNADQLASEWVQIGGVVREAKEPRREVAGARVTIRGSAVEATTDAAGRFTIPRVDKGPITIVVRAPGRPDVEHKVDVPSPSYDVEV